MKGRRHTPEQVVRKLREADRLRGEGFGLPDVLNELEVENAGLKRIVADQALEVAALKEISKGNW